MEYGFNVKRRKGLEDGDVGDSVNYTTLLDELERLDEMASTTTDPKTFSVLVFVLFFFIGFDGHSRVVVVQ
ncbi:hypothetical protein SO802_012341 [Lithocarpus litseifolius]|uniref:Uncharacterized protein n=1 Tax=Lithocarpus litseifolius TaxID=425828 RepID=A0AAW2D6J4_9ROSI